MGVEMMQPRWGWGNCFFGRFTQGRPRRPTAGLSDFNPFRVVGIGTRLSRIDYVIQPKVARNEPPWGMGSSDDPTPLLDPLPARASLGEEEEYGFFGQAVFMGPIYFHVVLQQMARREPRPTAALPIYFRVVLKPFSIF